MASGHPQDLFLKYYCTPEKGFAALKCGCGSIVRSFPFNFFSPEEVVSFRIEVGAQTLSAHFLKIKLHTCTPDILLLQILHLVQNCYTLQSRFLEYAKWHNCHRLTKMLQSDLLFILVQRLRDHKFLGC